MLDTDRANCNGADPGLFYPPEGTELPAERRNRVSKALGHCAGCPIRTECREYGQSVSPGVGIWGGVDLAETLGRRVGGGRKHAPVMRGDDYVRDQTKRRAAKEAIRKGAAA